MEQRGEGVVMDPNPTYSHSTFPPSNSLSYGANGQEGKMVARQTCRTASMISKKGIIYRIRSTLHTFNVTPAWTNRERAISFLSTWKGRPMTQKTRGVTPSKWVTVRIVDERGDSGVGKI